METALDRMFGDLRFNVAALRSMITRIAAEMRGFEPRVEIRAAFGAKRGKFLSIDDLLSEDLPAEVGIVNIWVAALTSSDEPTYTVYLSGSPLNQLTVTSTDAVWAHGLFSVLSEMIEKSEVRKRTRDTYNASCVLALDRPTEPVPTRYPSPIERDLVATEESLRLEERAEKSRVKVPASIEALLHPLVIEHSMKHYIDGNYREAVLNAMLALAETLRRRSGVDLDGAQLANKVLSAKDPMLAFTPRRNTSELDEHTGFHHIVLGAFVGVRNPKAHSLEHDLNAMKASQYLVFISLLIRRVDEALVVGRTVAEDATAGQPMQ